MWWRWSTTVSKVLFETIHSKGSALASHRHSEAYISLVLRGEYEETSVDGKYTVGTGSLLYHPAQHVHANHFRHSEAVVLNLKVRLRNMPGYRVVHWPRRFRSIQRLIRHHGGSLSPQLEDLLNSNFAPTIPTATWFTEITERLRDCSNGESLGVICQDVGVSMEHTCREFRRYFDVSPSQFRREFRLRTACAALSSGMSPSHAAFTAGFADQSHLGRVMKAEIGLTPANYSRQIITE